MHNNCFYFGGFLPFFDPRIVKSAQIKRCFFAQSDDSPKKWKTALDL